MRSGLRPKKGDLHVVLNDGENSIAFLLERDKITDRHREIVARMQKLAVEMVKLLGDAPPAEVPK